MKTPQHQTSAARDSTPIRTHSPYSEAAGPIVDKGYVEARVRAIEGSFKHLWAPQSSEPREIHHLPEWTLKGSQLRTASSATTMRKSSGQSDDPFSDIFNGPQSRKLLQHLSSTISPNHESLRPYRKSYSLANIRAQYEASPLQGKTGRKISNVDRACSPGHGILAPQPLLPFKLPIAVENDYEKYADYWNATHPTGLTPMHKSKPPDRTAILNESVAEGLSNLARNNTEPERTEPSTAWGSESQILEYPIPLQSSSEDDIALDVHPRPAIVNGKNEVDHGSPLKRLRPTRKVPDNRQESLGLRQTSNNECEPSQIWHTSDHSRDSNIESLSNVKRALTIQVPRRTTGFAAWGAKLRSMSFDQLTRRRQHDSADIGAAGQSRQNINIESEQALPTPIEVDEEREVLLSKEQSSRSRQSSSASASISMSAPRALRRAWRKWSGWQLNFAEKPSQTTNSLELGASTQEGSMDVSEAKTEGLADRHIKAEGVSPIQTPPPRSPKRPVPLKTSYSHNSLNPTAARPTTALSPPEIADWTPSFVQPSRRSSLTSQPSLLRRKQGSDDSSRPSLHHARSAASVVTGRSGARSSERISAYEDHGQAGSSAVMSAIAEHHRDSTDSTSTSTAYHSSYAMHKNSHRSLRSPWRERDGGHWENEIPLQRMVSTSRGRDRNRNGNEGGEQRIKRVKVVVSLDGTGDLMVDASVQQSRGGRRESKVKSFVKRWEAVALSSGS